MKSFKDLGISDEYITGLNELNIINPTEIQSKVIPILMNQNIDLVGQAQTGTGKTAAYGLPLLNKIDPKKPVVQGLILCPTRELGQQIAKQLFRFTKYTDKIFTEAVFGGAHIGQQIKNLQRPTHIIVATPGRLIDLVKKEAVELYHVKTIILDEADEMLSMGFKKELDEILGFLTKKVDSKWLFSATMPHGIREIVNEHMSANAHRIEVKAKDVVNKDIEHQYVISDEKEKISNLMYLLKTVTKSKLVVFCKTKKATKILTKQLIAKNIPADCIHGDLLQKERDKALRAFKKGTVRILVATDLAARGIDIDNLTYVVHYQLPESDEYYTHRSGRTARAGKKGISLCLVTHEEYKQLKLYEKTLGIKFNSIGE